MLQEKGQKKTVDELAEYFDVSRRTIFRDLNALQDINVPITWDRYSGYGVMPGYKIPPLMFSSNELATIIVGLNFVKSQVDKTLVEDAKGVEVKINNVLPEELKGFMNSLKERTVVDPLLKYGGKKRTGGNWYILSSAISQKHRVQFVYRSKSGETKTRKIDPYLLVYYEDHWNVIGYSHLRGEFRNFILENVSEVEILDEYYQEKKGFNVEGLIFRSNEFSQKIEVLVARSVLERFEANLAAKIFKKEAKNSEKIKVTFEIDNLDYINEWLLQFGTHVEVLAPKELKEKRQSLLREMLDK